jgi:hypothetical protein
MIASLPGILLPCEAEQSFGILPSWCVLAAGAAFTVTVVSTESDDVLEDSELRGAGIIFADLAFSLLCVCVCVIVYLLDRWYSYRKFIWFLALNPLTCHSISNLYVYS